MARTKKLDILSAAKSQAILFLLLGFLAGILYSVGGLVIDALVTLDWISNDETSGLSYGTILAFGALIGMPIIGAIFGFLSGVISTITYNLLITRFPWIKVNLN